jgi:hypothetical protein
MNIVKELLADVREGMDRDVAHRQAMTQRWRVSVEFDHDRANVETFYGPVVGAFDRWALTPEKRARIDAENCVQKGVWLKTGELIPPHRIMVVTVYEVEP